MISSDPMDMDHDTQKSDGRPVERSIHIQVSGYVCEILCGQLPETSKNLFAEYLIKNREQSEVPDWIQKRSPDFVSLDYIKRLWYGEDELMREIMKSSGYIWTGYRGLNDFSHYLGFGAGKEGIGLFEVNVFVDEKRIVQYVPFEPPEHMRHRLRNMERIRIIRSDPEPLPNAHKSFVAVSAGLWGKGAVRYSSQITEEFKEEKLALFVSDLTNLGNGEDHFVSGVRYGRGHLERKLLGAEENREFFPVQWYSPSEGKWLDMNEMRPDQRCPESGIQECEALFHEP